MNADVDIIPYQEIIGNYSGYFIILVMYQIIPYQEIIGNYSITYLLLSLSFIIPYQEIIGNYSNASSGVQDAILYHTKK